MWLAHEYQNWAMNSHIHTRHIHVYSYKHAKPHTHSGWYWIPVLKELISYKKQRTCNLCYHEGKNTEKEGIKLKFGQKQEDLTRKLKQAVKFQKKGRIFTIEILGISRHRYLTFGQWARSQRYQMAWRLAKQAALSDEWQVLKFKGEKKNFSIFLWILQRNRALFSWQNCSALLRYHVPEVPRIVRRAPLRLPCSFYPDVEFVEQPSIIIWFCPPGRQWANQPTAIIHFAWQLSLCINLEYWQSS